jgi:hypothetical protein
MTWDSTNSKWSVATSGSTSPMSNLQCNR